MSSATEGRKIRFGRSFQRHRDVWTVYVILAIVLVLFAMNQSGFFTAYGVQSLFNQVITLVVAALAQTLVILIGGIDLSIGSLISLTNCLAAVLFVPLAKVGGQWMGITLTCLLVLAVGAAGGLLNGLVIVLGRLQPIIATLATASIFGGVALYILPTPGGTVPPGFATFLVGSVLTVVPVSAIVIVFVAVFIWLPFRRSRFGQSVYATGGSEYSAYVSGIATDKTKVWTYTLAGAVSGLAGLLFTAQTASGDPLGGTSFTLNTIAAVILGGTSLAGGKGGYTGTIAGASILSLILGLLIFWNVSSFYQNAVQGLILIAALVIGFIQRSRSKSGLRAAPST